jgi:hypothetical protein
MQSKVRKYKPEEIDLKELSTQAEAVLHTKPFSWQLEIGAAVFMVRMLLLMLVLAAGKHYASLSLFFMRPIL